MTPTVLVSGAGRGLGLCLVNRYLAGGFTVFAATRRPSPMLAEVGSRFVERLYEIQLDVTRGDSVRNAAAAVARHSPSLDILINNAAILPPEGRGSLAEMAVDVGLSVFDVNALGPLRVTQAFLQLLEAGDRKMIVNVSSEAGSIGDCWRKDEFLYCMSKSALNMQTAILKNLLASQGFSLLALHPGWLRTDMGGPDADLDPNESADAIFELTQRRDETDSATYVDYRGRSMHW